VRDGRLIPGQAVLAVAWSNLPFPCPAGAGPLRGRCGLPADKSEVSTRLYAPWSNLVAPSDLPQDLKDVYARAADLVLVAVSFCSHPDRFEYTPEEFFANYDRLNQYFDALHTLTARNEVQLRAEAPEVLTGLRRVLGEIAPLKSALGGLVVMLTSAQTQAHTKPKAADYARMTLDDISCSDDCLTDLREALSVWAAKPNRRVLRIENLGSRGGGRGRRPLEKRNDEKSTIRLQAYQRIWAELDRSKKPAEILEMLQADEGFRNKLKSVGIKVNKNLIEAAARVLKDRRKSPSPTK